MNMVGYKNCMFLISYNYTFACTLLIIHIIWYSSQPSELMKLIIIRDRIYFMSVLKELCLYTPEHFQGENPLHFYVG